MLADSAFTTSSICVSAYKKKRGYASLSEDKELFNTLLAQARIRVEHCIGLLKNRFPSLRNIRILINGAQTMERIIKRVRACIVLHNLLVESSYPEEWNHQNEEDFQDNLGDGEDDNDDGFMPRNNYNRNTAQRRDEIHQYMMEWSQT